MVATERHASACAPRDAAKPLVAVPRPLDKLAEECKELELNKAKMSQAHGDWPVRVTEVIVERVDTLVDQLRRQHGALAGAGAAGASVPDSSASNASSDPGSTAPELGRTPSEDEDAAVVQRYFSDTKIFGAPGPHTMQCCTRHFGAVRPVWSAFSTQCTVNL
jgi:hypothetical protein